MFRPKGRGLVLLVPTIQIFDAFYEPPSFIDLFFSVTPSPGGSHNYLWLIRKCLIDVSFLMESCSREGRWTSFG